MTNIEQNARELLAAEWNKLGFQKPARELLTGCDTPPLTTASLNAISAALALKTVDLGKLLALAESWQNEAAESWGESPAHAAKQECCDELRALINKQHQQKENGDA